MITTKTSYSKVEFHEEIPHLIRAREQEELGIGEAWIDQDDPTDTGVPVDQDYIAAHEKETTVSVNFSGHMEACTPDGQPLATGGGDGSATGVDVFIDEKAQRHTSANESTSIVGSTFYAAPEMNPDKDGDWTEVRWNRLFLIHSGKDNHKRGDGSNINPRHKEDSTARFNHERAEVLCDRVGLTPRQKHAVLEAVDGTNFARFTYLCAKADDGVGAVEVVTVGIIACVLAYWIEYPLQHPAVEEAAETVGVSDVEYVSTEVADKMAFPWLSDGTIDSLI